MCQSVLMGKRTSLNIFVKFIPLNVGTQMILVVTALSHLVSYFLKIRTLFCLGTLTTEERKMTIVFVIDRFS